MFSFSVCFQIQQKNAHVTRGLLSVWWELKFQGGKKWVALAGFGFDSTFYWRDTCACDICVYQEKKE